MFAVFLYCYVDKEMITNKPLTLDTATLEVSEETVSNKLQKQRV